MKTDINLPFTVEKFESTKSNVWKYVFKFGRAIAESVLYRYQDRTVLCISVQSGCPVGCTFCGTGNNFIRNLTEGEIIDQVEYIIDGLSFSPLNGRFQIMFMSMGEPFLNYEETKKALKRLYALFPDAELLISTVGISDFSKWKDFIDYSAWNPEIGLQFSVHRSNDIERDQIIPYKNKLNLRQIRDVGIQWHKATNRPVFLNYFIEPGVNDTVKDAYRLKDLFSPHVFNFTFSVVCGTDKNGNGEQIDYNKIYGFQRYFEGYNTRIFDPAGQDIGGGCGQLWYVQNYLKGGNICH